jgi:hypothetical protein
MDATRRNDILDTLREAAGRGQGAVVAVLQGMDSDEVAEAVFPSRFRAAAPVGPPKKPIEKPKPVVPERPPVVTEPLLPKRKSISEIVSASDMRAAGGSESETWGLKIITDVVMALAPRDVPGHLEGRVAEVASGLKGIQSRDAIDAMMGALMISCFSAAQESLMFARAAGVSPYLAEQRVMHLAQAGQLARTVAQLAESFDRRRNGAVAGRTVTQRIVIERVVTGEGKSES